MPPKPLPKPPWLLYAAEVREQLDNLPLRKSEKRFERHELESWKTALRYKGYEGSLEGWRYLLWNLGKAQK